MRFSSECQMVMNVLWTRLTETGKDWRYVYKVSVQLLLQHPHINNKGSILGFYLPVCESQQLTVFFHAFNFQ